MKEGKGRLFLGLLVILIGVGFLLDQTKVLEMIGVRSVVKMMWPLMIMFFGVYLMINRNASVGLTFVFFGGLFFASVVFGWNIWGVLWPIIIIFFGLMILFRKPLRSIESAKSQASADDLNIDLIFSGTDRKITSENFMGGRVNCAFGGVALDLRNAKIAKEGATLEINCVFGGVEITVPSDCVIDSSGTSIFGAWENKAGAVGKDLPVLKITGAVVFGGVEIKS